MFRGNIEKAVLWRMPKLFARKSWSCSLDLIQKKKKQDQLFANKLQGMIFMIVRIVIGRRRGHSWCWK